MLFEKATNEDIAQLTDLRIAYLTEDMGKLDENERTIIKQNLPDYFMRNLNKHIFGYVAKDQKKIVACVFLLVVEKPMSPAFLTGKTGIVLNVYTRVEYRHKGYARRLMNMLMSDASDMGLSVVELKATEAGYQLYKSLGFENVKSKYYFMKWDC